MSGGSFVTRTLLTFAAVTLSRSVLAGMVLAWCLQIHCGRPVVAKSPGKAEATELITTRDEDSNTNGPPETENEIFHTNGKNTDINNKDADTSTETNNTNSKSAKEGSLPSTQGEPVAPATKYIGNSFSLKFHRPACPFAKVMRRSRRVSFAYRNAAIDAGQRPCKYCLPPWWLTVEAKLLNPSLQTGSGRQTPQQGE